MLNLAGRDPDLDLARRLYWETRVKVEDIGNYLGVQTGLVYDKVGPDGERPCPKCGATMPARQSRAGVPPRHCADCERAWRAQQQARMAAWQQEEWPAIQKEQARQQRLLHEWLAARGGEPPSPVFQVPGVDGFWCIGGDRVVRRADVAVTSDDPENGGYFLFDPNRTEPYG